MEPATPIQTTRLLAEFISGLTFEDLPPDVVDAAKAPIADCVGCGINGAQTPVGRIQANLVSEESGRSLVWGMRAFTTARTAALVNGTMSHADDFDDELKTMRGHAAAPVVPAIFAVGDAIGATGRDLVTAFAVGVEIEGRIGRAVAKRHPEVGWHATATLGTLGAAAACANLMRCNAEQSRNAIAIAASMAGGLRGNFGTMTKPLHAGLAAQNGVLAARLASLGMTGNPAIMECWQGFYDLFNGLDVTDQEAAVRELGTHYELLDPGITLKQYPSCSLSHPPIDIMLEGLRTGGIRPDEIEHIDCAVGFRLLTNMPYKRPASGLEAKFSMPYCLAAPVVFGQVTLAEFEDERVADPRIDALISRIEVRVHPDLRDISTVTRDFAEITVRHRSHPSYTNKIYHAKGTPAQPLSAGERRSKFESLVAPHFGQSWKSWWNALDTLEEQTPGFLRQLSARA